MISVIVPTMWKYPPFLDFLHYVVKLNVIEEVIIINNNVDETPSNEILDHAKIKMLTYGNNIYVNPAWNIGVNQSICDIVCILNDDMQFDLRLFYKIDEFMTPDMGAIGLCTGIVEYGQTPVTTGNIDFEPFTNQNCEGFGELMFVHKRHWRDIPAGLDIGFGDNFIFDYYHFHQFQNYFITNMWHHHGKSVTMSHISTLDGHDTQSIYNREKLLYEQIRSEMYHTNFIRNLRVIG